MVKCFAPGCTSGQSNLKEKVFLFKPSSKDVVIKWSTLIPRVDRPFGENDYLCTKHFDAKDIITEEVYDNTLNPRMQPRLVRNAIPKYFNKPVTMVIVPKKEPENINNSFIIKTKKTCVACKCSAAVENGRKISYYLFPINPQLRKEWISAADIKNTNLSEFSYLCSKHFEEHCFESVSSGTLKEDAIPTRFRFGMRSPSRICPVSPPSSIEDIKEDLTKVRTDIEKNSVPFCIVKTCSHKGNLRGITYHKIPKHNYEKWMNALQNYVKVYPIPPDSRVCSMHFKAKDFIIHGNKIKLNSEAVPKLHIYEHLMKELLNKNTNQNTNTNESKEEEGINIFNDGSVTKLRQDVLLSNVITPDDDIVKGDFSVIDINSIINKTLENEFNDTNKVNTVKEKVKNPESLTIIKAMHNYCDVNLNSNTPVVKVEIIENNAKRVRFETPETSSDYSISNENEEENKKKKTLIRKLNAYKNAYKRHKSLNRKQAENIVMLENKLEESVKTNKKLEQRILILEDIIHNILKKRDGNIVAMDNLEDL